MAKPDINERRKEAKIDIDTLENAIRILKASGVLVEKGDFDALVKSNKKLKDGVENLKPLIPLIPILETIAENQLVISKGSKWVVRSVVFLGIVIGIIYTLTKMVKGEIAALMPFIGQGGK